MSLDTKNKRSFKATSQIAKDDKSYITEPIALPDNGKCIVEEIEPEVVEVSAPVTVNEPAPYIPRKKKRFKLSLTGKKALSGWLFCLPFVIGILGIYLPIVLKSIEVGFHGSMGNNPAFTLDAYKFVFIEDGQFTTTVVDAIICE